ncbi:hypothetical protein KKG85_00310 [Patescibacteria group bacterium]|nr:hypothetical protein [Patescibacteria group bacterium]MBU2579555.1 hypothetical protein [Patescibacteria group bacterium]
MFEIKEMGKDGKVTVVVKAGKPLLNSTALCIVGVIAVSALLGGALIDWLAFTYLGLAAILAVLALNAIILLPTAYFGIPSRFGKRIYKKNSDPVMLEEGINFRWPLIEDLLSQNTKSKKLLTQEVTTKALSRDKLEVTVEGSVQYRIANLDTHVEMTEKTMEKGMVGAIESELGKICGVKEADVFVDERTEIEFLIKCVLQLERPPHHYIDEAKEIEKVKDEAKISKTRVGSDEKEIKETDTLKVIASNVMGLVLKKENIPRYEQKLGETRIKELVEKLSPEKWKLEKEKELNKFEKYDIDIIRFYKENATRIKLLFEFERDSEVEKLYGIKIATFRVEKLNFSEEAQKAFEKTRAAKAEMMAAEERFQKKTEMLKEYTQLTKGSLTEAVNLTETTADVKGITRQIISVEGSKESDLLALGKLVAGVKGGG